MGFIRVFVFSLVAAAAALAVTGPAQAEVNVNINLGPPPIVVAEPPAVVAIPQTRVYFAPDPHVDVFFYGGYWWSPRGPQWYRAKAYNGPWVGVETYRVPRSVIYVPRDYRAEYGGQRHIPYGQWKKDHERWDRENRKSHKKWEKEREKEWKERQKQEKHGKNGKNGKQGKGHGG
jgi:hypothetical protein